MTSLEIRGANRNELRCEMEVNMDDGVKPARFTVDSAAFRGTKTDLNRLLNQT